jgi:hypothetical protein
MQLVIMMTSLLFAETRWGSKKQRFKTNNSSVHKLDFFHGIDQKHGNE